MVSKANEIQNPEACSDEVKDANNIDKELYMDSGISLECNAGRKKVESMCFYKTNCLSLFIALKIHAGGRFIIHDLK